MNLTFFNSGKKIGLALGSGGARGLAHIGVIEGLEAHGYEISQIAGCSMGSLVGAIYASGNLKQFKQWINELDFWDVFRLMDFTLNSQGFIKGEKVFKEMESFIGNVNIEDLDIPYCAIATDLKQKKEVIFRKGSLYEAVRSSISIPTVLQPMEINGNSYIDGGIVNPLPIDHVNGIKVDQVLAVNLNSRKPYVPPQNFSSKQERPASNYEKQIEIIKKQAAKWFKKSNAKKKELNFFDLLNNSFDLTQDCLADFIIEKHHPDILIEISREACGTMEFYRAEEMIAAGREAFEQAIGNK